uniref:Si:ch1073-390k14.1 n=1 Tax=Tetraodon nigroviridis TaxID=99883 RepID=H3CFA9_TETNG
MKDCELSAPSQERQLRQPGGGQTGSGCVGPTSVSQTPRRGQICSAGADSREGNNSPEESGDLVTEVGALDPSGKPKRSKKRRRRRQGAGRQVVGLPPAPSAAAPVLLWFRRDLRLCDNPALTAALEVGAPVIPIFIWSPEEEEGPAGVTVATGGACKYWLHQALSCLCASLERNGSHLVFLRSAEAGGEGGSSLQTLKELVKETGARTVMANALYEPWLKDRDHAAAVALWKSGVECKMFHSYCLRDPYSVRTEGVGLRGQTSLEKEEDGWKEHPLMWLLSLLFRNSLPAVIPPCSPFAWVFPQVDWAASIRKSWDFSEEGAHARLEAFLGDGVYRYDKESGRADAPNTSCVSPYLHFGQLSPRWVLWDAKAARCRPPKFQRKLAWRDLAYWQLSLFPELPWESLRPPYKALRWSSDRRHLKAWQRGGTGYPLVDAAMRQLWLTGWMNNYMRHVVASFLIAYLHLPWQEGYRWFQDTLVDADVAIDAMMWQNGGMCGLDHWNFVMHPVDAAMTCDPDGSYVRKWCPELSGLPDELIHKPWKCPASVLRRAGVVLGQTYPERIVTDLEERRSRSLRDVALVRKQFGQYVDERSGCDLLPLPPRLVSEALGSSPQGGVEAAGGRPFLLPLITRMEFKHQQGDPDADAASNPYNAVLKGYVSRKRDEAVAFLHERDFTASVMQEGARRRERMESDQRRLEGLPRASEPRGRARRTPTAKDRFSVVPGGAVTPAR